MKRSFIVLLGALLIGSAASAQRLRVGIRSGVNFTDYKFAATRIGDLRFTPGPTRTGYEAGLVVRLNLSKHLHLQSEFNYVFANYAVHADGAAQREIRLRTERFDIPVQLGFQFGVLRLFGGATFRVANADRSNSPQVLDVSFNNDDVAIMGGIGLNIKNFFLDFRLSGYPRSHVWHDFRSKGESHRVKVPHELIYGANIGFFF